ncbi:hypothetical protein AFK68_22920 [Hydrocoleum sp. CS-953]|nr:hypothetical protein AFK68_22920 [Hydrocoleum sp. CS-953]
MIKISGLRLLANNTKPFYNSGERKTRYFRHKSPVKMFHFPEYLGIKVNIYLSDSKNVFVSQIFSLLPLTKNSKKSNSSGGKTRSYLQENEKVKMFHFPEYLGIKVNIYLSQSKNVFVSQIFGILPIGKNRKLSNSSSFTRKLGLKPRTSRATF